MPGYRPAALNDPPAVAGGIQGHMDVAPMPHDATFNAAVPLGWLDSAAGVCPPGAGGVTAGPGVASGAGTGSGATLLGRCG